MIEQSQSSNNSLHRFQCFRNVLETSSYQTPLSKSYNQISSFGRKISCSAIDCKKEQMKVMQLDDDIHRA